MSPACPNCAQHNHVHPICVRQNSVRQECSQLHIHIHASQKKCEGDNFKLLTKRPSHESEIVHFLGSDPPGLTVQGKLVDALDRLILSLSMTNHINWFPANCKRFRTSGDYHRSLIYSILRSIPKICVLKFGRKI